MHIDGHIRFIPLLAGLFALYSIGEILHLSPLIMVLLFGLALNNPKIITRFKPLRGWMDSSYETTLNQFKLLVMELTFAVRGFFFILLGYWTDLSDLASLYAWLSAAFMLSVVYAGRYVMLKSFRHSLTSSLTWIAPRGLITVVLFLGANNAMSLPRFLNGTIVLVVLVSAALVAVGQYHARAAGITSAAESDSESGTP
jgi:NhaP-type Na+/H+ or K+/H+ antiporter